MTKSYGRTSSGSLPPVLFGAGYGVCEESPHLGYAVKGRLPGKYYRDITLDTNQGD